RNMCLSSVGTHYKSYFLQTGWEGNSKLLCHICVLKKALYKSIHQLRAIGGSGILISPLTYIFYEKTPRWR
ncbi:hypothetical protein HN51_001624, partial [Arachis hypogaea]